MGLVTRLRDPPRARSPKDGREHFSRPRFLLHSHQSEFIQLAYAASRQFAKRAQCPPRSTTSAAFDGRSLRRAFRMGDFNPQAAARIANGLELDLLRPSQDHAAPPRRARSAALRARRCRRRLLGPTKRSGGEAGVGITSVGGWGGRTAEGFVSSESKNSRPASVICQPALSRETSFDPKISRSGTRRAKRFIRSVQSGPLDIRIATACLRSARLARPPGCPTNTFKIVN